jgi:YD repeat-containing protein
LRALASAEHPALGELRVETQGSWLRSLRLDGSGETAKVLLRAEYEELCGRIVELTLGEAAPQRFRWNALGQLESWQRADGSDFAFTYSEGLLSSVTERGKAPVHYSWQANPGAERGDSKWPSRVHLSADDFYEYSHQLNSKGLTLASQKRTNGFMSTVVFNPLLRRIEQREGERGYVIRLRKGPSVGSGIERIEDLSGAVLEDYHYDSRGQLIGVKRRGEPERTLSYDETGRLMSLDEGNPP